MAYYGIFWCCFAIEMVKNVVKNLKFNHYFLKHAYSLDLKAAHLVKSLLSRNKKRQLRRIVLTDVFNLMVKYLVTF